MKYENNWESLNSRPVPSWFEDAKLGIFIHWGLYSVPAYAPFGDYAEWYGWPIGMNEEPQGRQQMYIDFHKARYGENFKYSDFVSGFTAENFDANEWVELFRKSGAFEAFDDQVFKFVVEFQGIKVSVFGKGRGKADCRIACECAQFQDTFCSSCLHNYPQEFSLDGS